MNWQTFQHHGESPENAFEAFVTQLFERWCRRTFLDQLQRVYSLDGTGGDGGVEAFAVLENGVELGLQAKWFTGPFDDARAKKIRGSVGQALGRHPKLSRYIVCLPGDLKDSKAKGQKSGLDRWREVERWAKGEFPALTLDYWGDTELTGRLADLDDGSLDKYWFGRSTLGPADLAAVFKRTIAGSFATRYLPDLHHAGEIDRAVEVHLQTIEVRTERVAALRRLRNGYNGMTEEVRRLARLTGGRTSPE